MRGDAHRAGIHGKAWSHRVETGGGRVEQRCAGGVATQRPAARQLVESAGLRNVGCVRKRLATNAGGDDGIELIRPGGEALLAGIDGEHAIARLPAPRLIDRPHRRANAVGEQFVGRRVATHGGDECFRGKRMRCSVNNLARLKDVVAVDKIVDGADDRRHAQPVGVGLDDRDHRHLRRCGNARDVGTDDGEIDLNANGWLHGEVFEAKER